MTRLLTNAISGVSSNETELGWFIVAFQRNDDETENGSDQAVGGEGHQGHRRVTRKQYGAEKKIRIVLDGLRGEESIAALCRREGIAESLYYNWSKEFLEAGKKRLAGDTAGGSGVGDLGRFSSFFDQDL